MADNHVSSGNGTESSPTAVRPTTRAMSSRGSGTGSALISGGDRVRGWVAVNRPSGNVRCASSGPGSAGCVAGITNFPLRALAIWYVMFVRAGETEKRQSRAGVLARREAYSAAGRCGGSGKRIVPEAPPDVRRHDLEGIASGGGVQNVYGSAIAGSAIQTAGSRTCVRLGAGGERRRRFHGRTAQGPGTVLSLTAMLFSTRSSFIGGAGKSLETGGFHDRHGRCPAPRRQKVVGGSGVEPPPPAPRCATSPHLPTPVHPHQTTCPFVPSVGLQPGLLDPTWLPQPPVSARRNVGISTSLFAFTACFCPYVRCTQRLGGGDLHWQVRFFFVARVPMGDKSIFVTSGQALLIQGGRAPFGLRSRGRSLVTVLAAVGPC